MKYCTKCGNEMLDEAVVCVKCGCPVNDQANTAQQNTVQQQDIPSTGLKVLCFFIPIVGLILYATNISTQPISAKAYGKFALIGFIVSIALSVLISVLVSVFIGASMFMYY